ncbi:SatD family (SatD) [Chitinophaga sp. CF118]|uniref:SatD family protein n=1 Tax=Chitinophaga sp. CF118 TaxID=1884367 RepID=UPI0008E03F25|nr:SatD family protein [Chitinophaga sp. CF118]SFD18352.1 SatD family (SatD) [Chitinophaga sp. CF118]
MNFILMADIINSRDKNQQLLIKDFKEVVDNINEEMGEKVLSPLTITLGDEFQGILRDLPSALNTIINIEENILKSKKSFQLRYVLVEGKIETKINTQIAYEMLGPGLTEARQCLAEMKESNLKFITRLRDKKKQNAINDTFIVLQGLTDDWNLLKDSTLIDAFLVYKDYKLVAKELDKDRSLMWKRKKSLKLDEYIALKEVINYLGEVKD